MSRHRFTGGFSAGWTWTQWMIGVWWWPVGKDLAAGFHLGPLHVTWERHHRLGRPHPLD